MRVYRVTLALCLFAGSLSLAASQTKPLTLEQTRGRGQTVDFAGELKRYSWADDAVHLETTADGKTLRIHPETLDRTETPSPTEDKETQVLAKHIARLPGFNEAEARRWSELPQKKSADGAVRLLADDQEMIALFRVTAEESKGPDIEWTARRLPLPPGKKEIVQLSPDGRYVTYVEGGNLFLTATRLDRHQAISRDGSERLLYGKLDWVYQEEIYGRGNFQATWWSPDSRDAAFLRIDETDVKTFSVVDHIPTRLHVETMNYPKAGDPNPTVSLGVLRARDGRVTWIDLTQYEGSQFLIVRVGFDPGGTKLVFAVQDREQRWLDLNTADPETGEITTLFREASATWVDVHGLPRWLADGSFLWESDRTGNHHVYHYQGDGELIGAVTKGAWDVKRVLHVDEEARVLEFTGERDGAINTHVYRINLDGSNLERLTHDAGTHRVRFREDREFFLDRFSSIGQPQQLRLCNAKGEVVEILAEAHSDDWETYGYQKPQLFTIPARDGFVMDATLLKPADFDPAKRYPVWLATYSGPNAPSVTNRWNSSVWFQYLIQQGIVVFQVNNRSASGRGKAATESCYRQLGVQELKDLEDAVDTLLREPWADTARVGITGWSYGGFMTAYALTHSDRFCLGIAGAGVYDWRDYDTIYTERYMQTPQNNPDGYDKTSCLTAAADLNGELLLIHGTMDDNVHLQNTLQFAYALQKAGKQFDLMLYPKSRHRIASELRWHQRQLEWNKIREVMLEQPAGGASQ